MFDYDSAQIRESERTKIEAVADYLKKNAGVGVIIEGNCDERGSAEYNLALGERRALAARAYLIGLGIDGANLQTKSYVEEKPVNPGHDESAWSVNRRDEFVFFKR
jgi:peptidoglycan-associated lipoprotein